MHGCMYVITHPRQHDRCYQCTPRQLYPTCGALCHARVQFFLRLPMETITRRQIIVTSEDLVADGNILSSVGCEQFFVSLEGALRFRYH